MSKLYYNELEERYMTEAEFIADCKAYVDSYDGDDKPSLEEVILNTDYIYEVSDDDEF